MNDKEWEKLFELISKAVHMQRPTVQMKAAVVVEKAKEFEAVSDLSEFVCMLNEWADSPEE